MPKIILTDRDIENQAEHGVKILNLGDDALLTDLAIEKAKQLGITLVFSNSKSVDGGKVNNSDNTIENSKFQVLFGRYAMIKTGKKNEEAAFLVASDELETTIIVEESSLSRFDYSEIQTWFKLIRLIVAVPFFSVGFLAKVTSAIAQKGLNLLVESTFTYDYLLIREEELELAVNALRELGLQLSSS